MQLRARILAIVFVALAWPAIASVAQAQAQAPDPDRLAADAGCEGEIKLRLADGRPFETDSGNLILDCAFGQIADPEALEDALKLIPGVVESGLFLGIADAAVIAGPDGVVVHERDADDA